MDKEKFLASALAKVAEDKRETVKEAVSAILDELTTKDEILTAVTAAKQEAQGAAEAYRNSIVEWQKDYEADHAKGLLAIDELAKLKQLGDKKLDAAPAGNVDLTGYVKTTDVEKRIADAVTRVQGEGVGLIRALDKLKSEHWKTFNELLDTDELIERATKNRQDVRQAYDSGIADRLKERAAKQDAERVETIKKQAREEVIAEMSGSKMPYPASTNQEPSALDFVGKAVPKGSAAIDQAVQHYHQMQASRRES